MKYVRNGMSGLVLALALTGCDAPSVSDPREQLVCSIGEGAEWIKDCAFERAGDLLTIRHPDGGFRRFRILKDGHGVEAADGAEAASIEVSGGNEVEVRIAENGYRLPVRFAEVPR